MPLLVVERGAEKGKQAVIEPGKHYVIGRDNPQSALPVHDPLTSRQHFEIRSENGSFLLRDLKSRNGTSLNDEKVAEQVPLKIGDKIQVGETIFSFLTDAKEETQTGLVGKTIAGYRLLERIGRGGMGTVYKAEQLSLHRVVALKVLSSKLVSDPLFVEKFIREARAAGGLNHPNIVQVFDVGQDRNLYYFSMELIENGSVGDVVGKEGKVPWKRSLEMMMDAARGLVFAEEKGVVHRDIKPDNLMLTAQGLVKIGDLGLAKRAEETSEEGGAIFGTPHFIAPEQAQGKEVDHRADLYSLGATFYRVLSGKTPFSGENVREIVMKQITEEPVPLKKLVPDIPDEIAAVIGKLMKKRPADRYRSAKGLLDDLDRVRIQYHVETHGALKSAKRSKAIAAFMFLGVVALGGVAWYFYKNVRTEFIRGPSDPTPPPPPPPIETGPKPDVLAAEAFTPVKSASLDLREKAGGGPEKSWRKAGIESAWLEIARRFEKVGADFPDTDKGREAKTEAKRIRDSIDHAKAEWKKNTEAATEAWGKLLAEVDASAAEDRFAKALTRLEQGWKEFEPRKEYLPTSHISDRKDREQNLPITADRRVAGLGKAAEDAAAKFPLDDFAKARADLEAFLERLADGGTGAGNFQAAYDRGKKTIEETTDKARRAARDALSRDQEAYFRGYLGIRRFWPEGATEFSSPFFDYQWADAQARLKAMREAAQTWIFRERIDRMIVRYGRFPRIFETMAQHLNARDLKVEPAFPPSVTLGAPVFLDRAPGTRPATPEGVSVIRRPTGSQEKKFLLFKDMTPEELYENFLKGGTLYAMGADEHMDLALFLTEAGLSDGAMKEYAAAQEADREFKVAPDVQAWLNAEALAWNFVHDPADKQSVETMVAAYRAAVAGNSKAEAETLFRSLGDKLDEFESGEKYYTTDYFVLHYSQYGPANAPPAYLIPPRQWDQFVETFGIR